MSRVSLLEIRSLFKRYGAVCALEDLTLDLEGGAIGLLGPNGAGKSTLIKILLGFVAPTSGEARVFGLDARRSPLAIRERIGYMPENESFVPGMSAVAFVHLAARLNGLPYRDAMQRTHRVLNFVGVEEERYRTIESYSTGMKQKVKFAQALVHHPKLLLLDEPTAGLDPRARDELLALIRDIAHGKGIHVLLSTHILPDVETVCDRVVLLHQGRLQAHDDLRVLIPAETAAWEVRIKGESAEFTAALEKVGYGLTARRDGTLRLATPPGLPGTEPILRAAAETGVQVRHLSRPRRSLEDLFTGLVEPD